MLQPCGIPASAAVNSSWRQRDTRLRAHGSGKGCHYARLCLMMCFAVALSGGYGKVGEFCDGPTIKTTCNADQSRKRGEGGGKGKGGLVEAY